MVEVIRFRAPPCVGGVLWGKEFWVDQNGPELKPIKYHNPWCNVQPTYNRLIEMAKRLVRIDLTLSELVAQEAWNVKTRFRLKGNAFQQCRKCHIAWVPGRTVSIKYNNKHIVWVCRECGYKRTRWMK